MEKAATVKADKSEGAFLVQYPFNRLLDELAEELSSFGSSSDIRTALSEATRKRIEETYLCWEKVYLNDDGERVALEIAKTRQRCLHILHDFMVAIFSALPGSLDAGLTDAWIHAHGLILGLSKYAPVAKVLVEKGLLPYHMNELRTLRMNEVNWVLKTIFVSDLIILYNCARTVGIDGYFHAHSFPDILRPFTQASNNSMRLNAKLILAYASSTLVDEDIEELVCLPADDADDLLAALGEASTSADRKAGGFTVAELARALMQLLVCRSNLKLIAKTTVLPSVVAALSCGDVPEQRAVCQLVWHLLKEPIFKAEAVSDEFMLADILEQLQQSDDTSLQMLASCAKLELTDTYENDLASLTMYAKGCYEYGHYSDCAEICAKYSNKLSGTENQNDVQLMKLCEGKSLFHVYRRQAFHLKDIQDTKGIRSGKKYRFLHRQCYDNARRLINLLTVALDEGFIDKEGSRILDLAMVDYSRETNKLNECSYCLLCHKNARLCRSHFFPRNILEKFCSSMGRPEKGKQNITPMRPGPLQSPKGVTTFLFCESCEDIFNRNGEMQFSPKFLSKLYDMSIPESPKSEHHIHYERWLYQFCVGLVFRGLSQFYPHDYHNEDDVYRFFTQCREFLLNTKATALNELPKIALLINPTCAPPETTKPGFMDFALNYPLQEANSSLSLDGVISKSPERVLYFLVHFGIINIIGIVDPSQECHLPSNCFIQPAGGVLKVPIDQERYKTIPKGLWMFFEQTAVELETEHVRMSLSRLKWQEDNVLTEPPEQAVNTFGFVPSFHKDVEDQGKVLRPASIANVEKTFNFLPEEFQLHHKEEHSLVITPEGHKLILHYTSTDGSGSGHSVFLAVGIEGAFPPDRPYIIYHFYRPGLQMHAAFFVNIETFQPEEFLSDKDPKIRISDVQCFVRFRQDLPTLLPEILLSKGVYSLRSLLRRIQMRRTVNYDLKCQSAQFCWYCKDRCDTCMKTAAIGLTAKAPDSPTPLRFCSESCSVISPSLHISPYIDFWDQTQNPPAPLSRTCSLYDDHKELLYIFSECTMQSGYHSFDVTLCRGIGTEPFLSDRVYSVCYCRQRTHQLFFEFFLSEDLQVEEVIDLSKRDIEPPEEFKISANSVLQMIIRQALLTKGIHNVHMFLELYGEKGNKLTDQEE